MESFYLKTGDPDLDRILAMDEGGEGRDQGRHGILWERDETYGGVPIVLILGAAGSGKTTLALQFATEVATTNRKDRDVTRVFYYSLEQSRRSLDWALQNFGFDQDAGFLDLADENGGSIEAGKIHLCYFAPLPIAEQESVHAFEDRFRQLCHMIRNVKEELKTEQKPEVTLAPVFFIDSLNAIATSDLTRADICRLFALFRSQGIPAVFTAECGEYQRRDGNSISNDARFLADLVIELSSKETAEHLLQYLSITKSRVRRQALGKHLYKIRTMKQQGVQTRWRETPGVSRMEPDSGFLVYPSLPSIVSMTRTERRTEKELEYRLCDSGNESSIFRLMQTDRIKPGSCFSLVGPAGTHKLALGLNLASGYRCSKNYGSKDDPRQRDTASNKKLVADNKEPVTSKMLIISFGSYSAVDLSGVAWFADKKGWSQLKQTGDPRKPKWELIDFAFTPSCVSRPSARKSLEHRLPTGDGSASPGTEGAAAPSAPEPQAGQLILRVGHLTAEECFYQILKVIQTDQYSSVLVLDTAQICTGFPLLRSEPLFLPSLIDLFQGHQIVSVFVGVREEGAVSRDMDLALESAADFRLSFAHYPTPYDLAKAILEDPQQGAVRKTRIREQLVSVVLDNVTGKHYGRHPRWLMVEEIERGENEWDKTLLCMDTLECSIELRKRSALEVAERIDTLRKFAGCPEKAERTTKELKILASFKRELLSEAEELEKLLGAVD